MRQSAGFTARCEKEVVNSMIMLFEQEEAVKRYGNRIRSEALAEGRAEGVSTGRVMAFAEMVADGAMPEERAAEKLGMTVEQFRAAAEAVKETA